MIALEPITVDLVWRPNAASRTCTRHRLQLPPGATVADAAVAVRAPAAGCTYHVHGQRVLGHHPLNHGDELHLIRRPSGPLVGVIVFAVVSAAVGVGLNFLINWLLGDRPGAANPEGPDGPTYGFGGMQNARTQGRKVQMTFGEHRLAGQVIGQYRRNKNANSTDQYLYLVLGLGHGPLTSVGQYDSDQDNLLSTGSEWREKFEYSGFLEDPGPPGGGAAFWENVDGAADQLEATGAHCEAVVSTSDAAYRARQDIGADSVNVRVRAQVLQYGANQVALAINLADLDNHHGLEFVNSGTIELYQMVATVRTVLASFSANEGDTIELGRHDDVLKVRRNGTLLGEYAANPALTNDRCGLVKWGSATATETHVDTVTVRGEARLPRDMHLNGMEANTFRDVAAWLRLGTPSQTKLPPRFSKVIRAYQPGIALRTGWVEYDMHREVEGFQLVLEFPAGLFDQTSGFTDASVTVEVEYRPDETSPWAPITGSPFTFTHALTGRFSRTVFLENESLTGTAQQIRVRRTTAPAGSEDALVSDEITLADVNEILRDDRQRYENDALLAVRIKATDQLSGTVPLITAMAKGVAVPQWNGQLGGPDEPELFYQWSQNPAWVALAIMLDPKEGLGNEISVADIDWDSWYDWATYCDELLEYADYFDEPLEFTTATEATTQGSRDFVVDDAAEAALFDVGDFVLVEVDPVNLLVAKLDLGDGRTLFTCQNPIGASYPAGWRLASVELDEFVETVRHTFNGVFDGEISAWEAVIRVARVGRAMVMKQGNRWRVRIERPDDPVQLVTESNMDRGSMKVTYVGSAERPDTLTVQYLEADDDYDQGAVTAPGLPPAKPEKLPVRNTMALYGVTNRREARREARYHLRAQQALTRRLAFTISPDGLAAEAGDVINVGAVMPRWSRWTSRANGTLQSFRIDQALELETGDTYQAMIRTADNRAAITATITSPSGSYAAGDTITTDAADADLLTDALVAIGRTGTVVQPWRIVRTKLLPDFRIGVQAVEYKPELYGLSGWTENPEPCVLDLPPPGGEITEDCDYILDLNLYVPCTTVECENAGAPCEKGQFCCCTGTVSIDVTGDGAPCVIVGDPDENGLVIITVLPGCAGQQVCINLDWDQGCTKYCFNPPGCAETSCPPGPLCAFAGTFQCEGNVSLCFDIVVP